MIRIAICDDEKIYIDLIYSCVSKHAKDNAIEVSINKYLVSQTLINEHKQNPFDILFLDIDMPIASGFDISRTIRETSDHSYIVFVSAKHEMVYSSFEYNPFYFICKRGRNNLNQDIEYVLSKLLIHFQQHKKIEIIDTSKGKLIIKLQDIVYIKSDRHYVQYHLVNRTEPYIERKTLKAKEAELCCPDFIRPHQRFLVNANHIVSFGGLINTILLDNNHRVPISKTLKETATQSYLQNKRR